MKKIIWTLALLPIAALALAACGSHTTSTKAPVSSATAPVPSATAPVPSATAGIPATSANQALCKLVQTQLQIDAEDSETDQQVVQQMVSAALQHSAGSPELVGLVSTWEMTVSNGLDSGQAPTSGPGLQAVEQACASIGVTV